MNLEPLFLIVYPCLGKCRHFSDDAGGGFDQVKRQNRAGSFPQAQIQIYERSQAEIFVHNPVAYFHRFMRAE